MSTTSTNVETTEATTQDQIATPTIHTSLQRKKLLPERHVVDQGYISAQLIMRSQNEGIDLMGPVLTGSGWQAQGFCRKNF